MPPGRWQSAYTGTKQPRTPNPLAFVVARRAGVRPGAGRAADLEMGASIASVIDNDKVHNRQMFIRACYFLHVTINAENVNVI